MIETVLQLLADSVYYSTAATVQDDPDGTVVTKKAKRVPQYFMYARWNEQMDVSQIARL